MSYIYQGLLEERGYPSAAGTFQLPLRPSLSDNEICILKFFTYNNDTTKSLVNAYIVDPIGGHNIWIPDQVCYGGNDYVFPLYDIEIRSGQYVQVYVKRAANGDVVRCHLVYQIKKVK